MLIPIIMLSGLMCWRYLTNQQALSASQTIQQETTLNEVPKTLPAVGTEANTASLQDTTTQASPVPRNTGSTVSDSRIKDVESAITNLRARVSALEKATPSVPAVTTSKYPLYIPLGSGGGPWGNADWYKLDEYMVTLNSEDYAGYSSMQLEVNFRLAEPTGKGSVRLYNVTDQAAVSSQVDNSTATFSTQTSGTFKLASGQKTYTLQMKSTEARSLFIQSARIKVNF